jgi:2-furoyl-CoA dehydrogenase 2Fe-2S iron sulfur subunit
MRVCKQNDLHKIELAVNGKSVSARAEPRMLLSDFLRDKLGFTGTHVGCEHGVCGACTVLVNGKSARSCLMLAVQVQGCDIQTVEGFSEGSDSLSDIQAAFRRHHALQCGFCTPGILISVSQLLETETSPSEKRIRDVLSGHLCRCTGYRGIIDAVLEVAQERKGVAHD